MKSIRFTLSVVFVVLMSTALHAQSTANPVRNIVLVHGAWVDGSGWKPVSDILTKRGYRVSIVQEPETSFKADVAAVKRVLDQQRGPCILVAHSYGGSVITEAGVHSKVAGLVYVAAHAPDIGEDEATLGAKHPSILAKTKGAIQVTSDGFTFLRPDLFPKLFAPELREARANFMARSQVLAAAKVFHTPLTAAAWRSKPSWGIVAGADQIINPDLEKWYYARAKSHWIIVAGAGHDIYEARPKIVASVIEKAAVTVAGRINAGGVSE
jgi:pimeloyl-ACP methyl ester carboxylesterase